MDKIRKKIEKHYTAGRYVTIIRKKGKFSDISSGFVLKFSEDFILLQESENFRILGYQIIPIETIQKVRYNKQDKVLERILKEEGAFEKINAKYDIDLTSWETLCADIQQTGLTVISECEHPALDYFCIGKITAISEEFVSIRNFNSCGLLDDVDTEHDFKDITKLSFDDRYANIFSKYVK